MVDNNYSERELSKIILKNALKIEEEQGYEYAKKYYDLLLNVLGVSFHRVPRKIEFMLNRLDSIFDYFDTFEDDRYITYLENLMNIRRDEIKSYYAYNLNKPALLEAITLEYNAAKNILDEILINHKKRI